MTATESSGPRDTERVAAGLAAELALGDVVLIEGDLGAGKTTFVRGALRALGVSEPVVSPTFTIGRRYSGAVPVSHLDLYRLDALGMEDPGLLDDYVDAGSIAFVEWPAVAAGHLPRVAATVRIEHAGGDSRLISINRA